MFGEDAYAEAEKINIIGGTNEDVLSLENLPTVKVLTIASSEVTDAGLAKLSKLPRLNSLHVMHAKITPSAMGSLRPIQSLDFLLLAGEHITDEVLANVSDLTQLTALEIKRCPITSVGLTSIAKTETMEQLTLNGLSALREDDLQVLQRMKKLHWLKISHLDLSERGLEHLAKIPSLETLCLCDERQSPLSVNDLDALNRFPKLKALSFEARASSNDVLLAVAKISSLEELQLIGDCFTSPCTSDIARLKNLERLAIDKTKIDAEGIKPLLALTNLKEIWLPQDVSSEAAMSFQGKMPACKVHVHHNAKIQ
ncbi:hypothetical protein NA78x_006230 [Anatilimnocola sp. NA78]|uniref:hypothetical protein n=1 Tax=Anatilimnocola sp. NA78 TaxID=3415683 RepID=UPI003CE4A425